MSDAGESLSNKMKARPPRAGSSLQPRDVPEKCAAANLTLTKVILKKAYIHEIRKLSLIMECNNFWHLG